MNNLKKTALVSCMLIASILTSCAVAVVAGAAAGLIVYDRRGINTLEQDARIFYVIHKKIVSDARFRDSHISVVSFNQVILLVGQTPKASLRVLAERIAQSTAHVKRVYNEIALQSPTSLVKRSQDTWITSQVRARMLTKKGLESGSIRVVTENSVVYLMGIVSNEQAATAVAVARQIEGVKKVVKVFQYIR